MKKYLYTVLLLLAGGLSLYGQEKDRDSLEAILMKEVIVIGKKQEIARKETKSLATVDEYLEKSSKVNMIKRGAYAWEPMLNGMATERTVLTIDGMRIFSACTDKMDPITSYVEISNLSEAAISSGQEGAGNGSTIGGGIDLKRRKTGYTGSGWKIGVSTGGESNGEQKIAGTEISYGTDSFYFNTDFMYRDAENYFAGGDMEVMNSQFTKYNFSAIGGLKLSEDKAMEASVIYDNATEIGYPALPMDVSRAQAVIASMMYEQHQPLSFIDHWESKLYFNQILHRMDDSGRPDVPIRMDMPGLSDTYGFYSKASTAFGRHSVKINLSSFYNRSLAEMTMFPNDASEKEMYMLTWPDVRTLYNGIYVEDLISLDQHLSFQLTASLGSHYNKVESLTGLQSLRIFFPEMERSTRRFLSGFSSRLQLHRNSMDYSVGIGYGERAPSVSEAYGYYLFNSFDGFDYLGNPHLNTERSVELNAATGFKKKNWSASVNGSYFHIKDYIIGKPDLSLSPMTIGANGIKIYEQLQYASLFNTNLALEYTISKNIGWNGKIIYSYGKDHNDSNLPLVQPLSYYTALQFRKGLFSMEASLEGAAKQYDYSPEFGENKTPAYAVVNLAASHTTYINQQRLNLKLGAENLFDNYYATFSDWNNIPRRGRNLFVNLSYSML